MVEEMQKNHQFIIMHCANNVKGYPNFRVSNLNLKKKKKVQTIFINEQCDEYYN